MVIFSFSICFCLYVSLESGLLLYSILLLYRCESSLVHYLHVSIHLTRAPEGPVLSL